MRAVIEHRLVAGAKGDRAAISYVVRHWSTFSPSADNTLYFGCRSASKDQHYAPEWKTYSDDEDLVYRLAPSRDGPEGTKRTYVQDLMMQDSKRIWEAVDQKGAYLYISGYVFLAFIFNKM
jgi:sulfite reductase alpha subunit-like flavoprotein